MNQHPLDPAGDRQSLRGRSRQGHALPAAGLCILVLECSQVLYTAVERPDLAGVLGRALLAASATPRSPVDAAEPADLSG